MSGYSHECCVTTDLNILEIAQIVDLIFCDQVGVNISLLVACKVPSLTKRIMAPCRHQLDFFMFSELCEYCHWQWDPAVSLPKATLCLSNNLGYLEIFVGPFGQPRTQLIATQSCHWKPLLATGDGQYDSISTITRSPHWDFIDTRKFPLH